MSETENILIKGVAFTFKGNGRIPKVCTPGKKDICTDFDRVLQGIIREYISSHAIKHRNTECHLLLVGKYIYNFNQNLTKLNKMGPLT